MSPDAAITAVLREARRYLGTTEHPPGSNRGLVVDYCNAEAGVALGSPWCCAWAMQVGRQALGTQWPLPRTASVMALVAWAQQRTTLGVWRSTPGAGDLFLLWEPGLQPPRYGHTGFVEAVDGAGYSTVEGNTNPGGGREGYGVFARRRAVEPLTRFIQWTAAMG